MLNKSHKILYVFNFDGTLFGLNYRHGILTNSKQFLTGPIINPGDKDIRWHILCNRPPYHKLLVRSCCWIWGLYPQTINMTPYNIGKIKKRQEVLNYKLAFFRKILIGNNEQFSRIEKIFYFDTNLDDISYMNAHRHPFKFVCGHIKDFIDEKFSILL